MKRVIMHWTAGTYNVSALDKEHYHFIVSGDGVVVPGKWPVSANENPVKGKYAAHTLNCNTGSIGISMACMAGAEENKTNGKYPMTDVQFEAMCERVATLCFNYHIPITPKTVLSHAEVQTNLGIKQRGKWDFTVLPFKPKLKGAKVCGDYARERVLFYFQSKYNASPVTNSVKPPPVAKPVEPQKPIPVVVQPEAPKPQPTFWQRFLSMFGVKS